jgi:hypothetical protein
MLTKESIIHLLKTDDRAVARALVVLTARQTDDEQASENTRYLNGRGFRPAHARMGTNMSKFFQQRGYLSHKQIAYWRVCDRTGAMRIGIYWAQLLEEAQIKAQKKNSTRSILPGLAGPSMTPTAMKMATEARDFGNDIELRMVLNEQYNDVLDSDDPTLIDPIKSEMDEIDAFWAKVRAKQS